MTSKHNISEEELEGLRDTLKRCPSGTFEALLGFRSEGDLKALEVFIVGVLKRHVEPEYESLLDGERAQLSFVDDLGVDSMTMMEVVMMVEECLDIRLENQHLMQIQTFSDLDQYITCLLYTSPSPRDS